MNELQMVYRMVLLAVWLAAFMASTGAVLFVIWNWWLHWSPDLTLIALAVTCAEIGRGCKWLYERAAGKPE